VTVEEVWPDLDPQAKRSYLINAGAKVRVLSSATLRATPGAEVRYVTGGSPDRIVGNWSGSRWPDRSSAEKRSHAFSRGRTTGR